MNGPSPKRIIDVLLKRHQRTYAAELGIDLAQGTPSVLFRWLCAAILLSARIGAKQAMQAARALADQGWTTAEKMAGSTWEERTRTLNRAGYARYDESTSRMLGDTAGMLLERYGGDLRKLREAAGREPARERELLKQCKGLGDVGVSIFCREVQQVWDELYPFADERALAAAGRLGLESDAQALAQRVSKQEFPPARRGVDPGQPRQGFRGRPPTGHAPGRKVGAAPPLPRIRREPARRQPRRAKACRERAGDGIGSRYAAGAPMAGRNRPTNGLIDERAHWRQAGLLLPLP